LRSCATPATTSTAAAFSSTTSRIGPAARQHRAEVAAFSAAVRRAGPARSGPSGTGSM
jgi:hypothetical protein